MSESLVAVERHDGVLAVKFNRPQKRNALTRQLIIDLAKVIDEAANDPSVRVLVLGAEGHVFCAGMDLGEMQERATSDLAEAEWQNDAEVYRHLVHSLIHTPFPTIASLQGPAVAGGVGLALACDLRIASESAFLALPEPQRGITAAMVTPLLILRAGPAAAHSLLLSGERCSAADAKTFGICHDVVPDDRFEDRVNELVQSVLTGSAEALKLTKAHLLHCLSGSLEDRLDESMQLSARARKTDDAREGLAAFLEKRPPSWQQFEAGRE